MLTSHLRERTVLAIRDKKRFIRISSHCLVFLISQQKINEIWLQRSNALVQSLSVSNWYLNSTSIQPWKWYYTEHWGKTKTTLRNCGLFKTFPCDLYWHSRSLCDDQVSSSYRIYTIEHLRTCRSYCEMILNTSCCANCWHEFNIQDYFRLKSFQEN